MITELCENLIEVARVQKMSNGWVEEKYKLLIICTFSTFQRVGQDVLSIT